MRTAIVILNWNTKDYIKLFLPALLMSVEGKDASVIVADSASTDGSLDLMASMFPQVRTIPLDRNYGFTGGYNKALSQIAEGPDCPEYIVLINSDIEVGGDWLEPLTGWMDAHPECGVCGPKLHSLVFDGQNYVRTDMFEYAGAAGGCIDRFGFPFCRGRVLKRTALDEGQYDSPQDVLWVSGACLLTRTSLWQSLGGLDDRFFAHMEEIDYCWRAQLAGFKVTVVPQSCVHHLGGGTLPQTSPFKLKLNYRNGLLLLDNNLSSTIGPSAARRRIRARLFIDNCSAAVYLLTGRLSALRAVREAHREYHSLRTERPYEVCLPDSPLAAASPLSPSPAPTRAPSFPRMDSLPSDSPLAGSTPSCTCTSDSPLAGSPRTGSRTSASQIAGSPRTGSRTSASQIAGSIPSPSSVGRPAGIIDIDIILLSLVHGKKIFNYLTRYEDSH